MSESKTGAGPGLEHRRTVEVFWGDCDAAGVVFYPNYYAWFDASTHAMLTAAGLDHHHLRDTYKVIGTPLVTTNATYHSPSTYGDRLEAYCRVSKVGAKSFTVRHRLSIGDRVVVEGEEVRVWAAEDAEAPHGMRADPIPSTVRSVLEGAG